MTQQVQVSIRGICPIPWGSNEWAWRKALADSARDIIDHSSSLLVSPTTHFSVHVLFLMTAAHVGRADLDNLAKPVLDTLFRPRYAQVKDMTLTGALFNVDDDRVFRLTLEKRQVDLPADEGADVTICWDWYP